MNLNKKLKIKILIEFKRGMALNRLDDTYMQKPGTAERVIREALVLVEESEDADLKRIADGGETR